MSILIIDDDQDILDLLQYFITAKYPKSDVITCSSPIKALDIVEQNKKKLKLIISDIKMPEITGIEFARKINNKNYSIELIFMTAYHIGDITTEAYSLRVDKVINKNNGFPKVIDEIMKRYEKITTSP